MHKLQAAGLPLPEIYVCSTREEAAMLCEAGIPYIKTQLDDIDIVKAILIRVLEEKFPRIKWHAVLGIKQTYRVNVIVPGGRIGQPSEKIAPPTIDTTESDGDKIDDDNEDGDTHLAHRMSDIAEDYREFDGYGYQSDQVKRISVDEFCYDAASHVNIETLQSLGFLPKFMDDAADAIRINLENRMAWHECWNKRLGAAVGDVTYGYDAANLIILDISGSIPEGISATMLQLIDTLRMQTNAELIITGSSSIYWSNEDELPTPEWIRSHIDYGNECEEFFKILKEKVDGRHFGNVISFGDNDSPYYDWDRWVTPGECLDKQPVLTGVRVDRVLHYHTTYNKETGYARWVKMLCPDVEMEIDTSWCSVMR